MGVCHAKSKKGILQKARMPYKAGHALGEIMLREYDKQPDSSFKNCIAARVPLCCLQKIVFDQAVAFFIRDNNVIEKTKKQLP